MIQWSQYDYDDVEYSRNRSILLSIYNTSQQESKLNIYKP